MTTDQAGRGNRPESEPVSTSAWLPFDPNDLASLRVLPSEFARICGVSRQAVSVWIKRGTISLGPDGRLDPIVAGRQVMARTDPARMRARVFKDVARDVPDLRRRVQDLDNQMKAERAEHARVVEAFRRMTIHQDDLAMSFALACEVVAGSVDQLVAARDAGTLPAAVEDMLTTCFYGGIEDAEEPQAD